MENMKAQYLTQDDIRRACLFQHEDGEQVITLRLKNGMELRFASKEGATICGFLDYGTENQRFVDEPLFIEDKVGL